MKQVIKTLLSVVMMVVLVIPTESFAQNVTKTTNEVADKLFVTVTLHDVRDDVAQAGDRDI